MVLTGMGESGSGVSNLVNKVCTRCILPSTFPRIEFDSEGVCSICRDFDRRWSKMSSTMLERRRHLQKICTQAKNKHKEFDALIPLSGGKDSVYVLYVARQELGLKCIAFTYDNGYLSQLAKNNIETACKKLGVEHIYYRLDPNLANRLYSIFLKKTGWFCPVCMRGIGMATSLLQNIYRAPLTIRGSSPMTELPLSREMFPTGPASLIKDVLNGEPISGECKRLCGNAGGNRRRQFGQLLFMLSKKTKLTSYATFNLSDYVDWNYEFIIDTLKKEVNWTFNKNSEHMDCMISPIQEYIHNQRFPGLEMKKLTLAKHVMAGLISRKDALQKLEAEQAKESPEDLIKLFLNNINMNREEFDKLVDMGPRHLQYNTNGSMSLRLANKIFSMRNTGSY